MSKETPFLENFQNYFVNLLNVLLCCNFQPRYFLHNISFLKTISIQLRMVNSFVLIKNKTVPAHTVCSRVTKLGKGLTTSREGSNCLYVLSLSCFVP